MYILGIGTLRQRAMPVLARLWSGPKQQARALNLPLEIEAALVAPLYTRIPSFIVAHVASISLCLFAVVRIGGSWPAASLAASLAASGTLGWVILRVGRLRAPVTPGALLRWRRPYQVVGFAWAVTGGLTCAACVVISLDELCRLLAIGLMLGTCGGIAARNAGTPGYATGQLCGWLVPLIITAPVLGSWYWLLSVMTLLYLVAMQSITWQYYTNTLSLIRSVADSRQAQLASAARASEYQAIFDNAAAGAVEYDSASNRLVRVNRVFCQMMGRSEADLLAGVTPSALTYPDDWDQDSEHWAALTETGEACSVEKRYLRPDGAIVWAQVSASIVPADGDGFPARTIAILQDITGRKVTEAALQASEEMLRLSLEVGRIGSYRHDLTAGVLHCDPQARRMHGLPCDDAPVPIGVWAAMLEPEDRERLAVVRSKAYAERRSAADFNYRFLHPVEGLRHIEMRERITYDDAGRPVASLGVVIDVTDRRAIEAELQASEEMLRLSLAVGRIGSYRQDHAAGVLICGAETRRMHGFPAGDMPITLAAWRATLLPEDRERVGAELAATYAEQRSVTAFEYRILHPSDGVRHIETRSRITYAADGKPNGSIGVAIDVTDRRLADARIRHLAQHDTLTELPNRSLFRARLEEALVRARRGERFAVCCLDLDHFKDVNDTLGHPVGDALLRAVSERLTAAARPTDTVARLGGDEFAIIQSAIDQPADATALAKRLIDAITAPFDIEGHRVVTGASIGISLAPDDGLDADWLLRKADLALYSAKGDGRGRYRFFEPEMDARMQARRALELELREAVDAGAFELFYQPQVGIATGRVQGFEALLRWRHPTRGLIPPDRFIPLAEATGLIVPLGTWVLRSACAEAATWSGAPRVAVNVSAVQFASQTLVSSTMAALQDSGLDPRRLELEITESALLNDTEANLATLHRLKALGVSIAMDDFGTGYSSLSYLQRFPFDKVKIDRAFIADLGHSRKSAAIVGAVIELCTSLDMRSTAEGVETASQFAALARIGCTEAQGYFFSRPCPATEIPALIERLDREAKDLIVEPMPSDNA